MSLGCFRTDYESYQRFLFQLPVIIGANERGGQARLILLIRYSYSVRRLCWR